MNHHSHRRRKGWIGLLLAIIVVAQIGFVGPRPNVAAAADNGLALKPYMGWSSYSLQVYDGQAGNWISEAKIKKMSDAMHEKLQAHGYNYINIDAGWNGSMDGYGRPIPSAQLYPGGFENLVDYVHRNGQKLGIYLIPGVSPAAVERNLPIYDPSGPSGCTIGDIVVKPYKYADYWNLGYKIDFSNPCAQKYIDSIADLIASWGVDFVKFDSVTPGSGHNDTSIDARDDVKAWSQALSKHRIWFELSWALDHNYADYWKQYANGWRVDWDVEAYDRNVGMTQWSNIARLFPDAALWWRDAGPGGWNDFDSLNVGNGATSGLTKDERQTAMTLWAASSAQLYTGDDLSNLDAYGLSLLTNDEVIAVQQAGHPVHPVSTATDQQAWYANNGDGTYTVALFNLGSKGATVGVNWRDIGLDGSASVRDLWSHEELGTYDAGIAPVYLEPHASRLFKVTAKSGTSAVNDDDTGMRYAGTWTRNGGNELVRDAQDLTVLVADSSPAGASQQTAEGTVSDNQAQPDALAADAADPAAVSHTVLINDNDPAIQYANRWGYSSGRSFGDYMGDVHYGEPDNGTQPEASYTFSGMGIEVLVEMSPSSGKLDVYVDGEFKETVDAESPTQAGQYAVYGISGLDQGPHTIKIARNDGGQYYFLLDAFKVTTDTLLGTPSSNSFNKDQPVDVATPLPFGSASLAGIKNGAAALQLGTDYAVSDNVVSIKSDYLMRQPSGQSAELTFEFAGGDTQRLTLAISGTSIDPTAASFDKRPSAQSDLAVKLTLPDGNSLTGIKNGDGSLKEGEDYAVAGDVVHILKAYLASLPIGVTTLTFEFARSDARTLAVTVSNSSSPGRYAMVNDDDPAIRYTGAWNRSSGRNFGDYKDDVHWVENNGDFFTYTFQGTGIDLLTEVDQGQGNIEVYIDDASQGLFSTYEANAHNKPLQTVFSISGLANGLHTIKAVKRSGQFMLLDALRVQLPDLLDVSSVDYDKAAAGQTGLSVNVLASIDSLTGISNGANALVRDADYTVEGGRVTILPAYLAAQPVGTTKLTFSFAGDYGDDVHASAENGAFFQYTFKGTGVELLFPTGPRQGNMDVYIDGQLRQTVSAYAAARNAQQQLFAISGLTDGTHTIKVVKASGELMLVDALRFAVPVSASGPDPGSPGDGGGGGGGGNGGGGSGTVDTTPIVTVKRTQQPDGTFKDEAKLTGDIAKALIDRQQASGSKAIVVAIPDAKDEASLASVTLDQDAVGRIARSGLDLDLDTANVKIHIPNASLQGLDGDVIFKLVPVRSTERGAQIAQRANGTTIVTAATGGAKVALNGRPIEIETNLQNREVTLMLPLQGGNPSAAELGRLGVYIEHGDGTKEFKRGSVAAFGDSVGLRFTTSKFSTFALVKAADTSAAAHAAYIQGFEGGLFKPEKVITRAEMATILSRVATRDGGGSPRTYSDVKPGHWAAEAIAQATVMGLMNGFADGTSKPEQPITRAEMAVLAVRVTAASSAPGEGFKDTIGSWAENEIRTAQGADYLKGYEDGTFRPNDSLTRAEAVVILNRTLSRGPLNGLEQSPWRDVPSSHWAVRDILEASVDHNFAPADSGGEQQTP
ncbi:X2-like carbohydrate binding domain-containing protein [Cohnella sp. REN36]|uniref:X2-like carbohydrate binding domain-containing protein n=1 Tax=Cohnella sp. REN36 TaxID=2887347 RepID=UPI001D146922|nr:X2-like carbohydrate binding domain-containing protein [Cohnella sp. REN36]MCC3371985.1 S-layer homology domain-containing protein [Cohnella sp. REN36]